MSAVVRSIFYSAGLIILTPGIAMLLVLLINQLSILDNDKGFLVGLLAASCGFLGGWYAIWVSHVNCPTEQFFKPLFVAGLMLLGLAVYSLINNDMLSEMIFFCALLSCWGVWIGLTGWFWTQPHSSSAAANSAVNCPKCGYSLTGLNAARCPECGAAYTLDQLFAANRDADSLDR